MQSYPLHWPDGWKRTKDGERIRARFSKQTRRSKTASDVGSVISVTRESYMVAGPVTIAEGTARVLEQLRLFGVRDYDTIVSTNVRTRADGLPRSGEREPADPGVAVYWKHKGRQQVMAVDAYDRVADNLAAIAATLDAMRAIERHGGATILDRAFTGFVALPEPNNWRHILGLTDETATLEKAEAAYKRLAMTRHPDRGGSHEQMAAINRAYEEAKRELS